MYNDEGKPEDLIPEELAIRRGMVYSKDRHGKVCQAEIEAPLLIDQLYNHEIIDADHHFYGVQFMTMRKLFLSPVAYKIGMFIVRRDPEQSSDKAIPMDDADYLKVLRKVKHIPSQRLLQDICDESADPTRPPSYTRLAIIAAFTKLCAAVRELWDEKDACATARGRA